MRKTWITKSTICWRLIPNVISMGIDSFRTGLNMQHDLIYPQCQTNFVNSTCFVCCSFSSENPEALSHRDLPGRLNNKHYILKSLNLNAGHLKYKEKIVWSSIFSFAGDIFLIGVHINNQPDVSALISPPPTTTKKNKNKKHTAKSWKKRWQLPHNIFHISYMRYIFYSLVDL